MDHIFTTFLFFTFAAVASLLVPAEATPAGFPIAVSATAINNAPTSGTSNLPLLEDLVTCPLLPPGVGGIYKHNFADFLLVNCSSSPGLIALDDCNAALAKAHSFTMNYSTPILVPVMPLLTYSVSASNPYTSGYYATYVGRLNLFNTTGIGFQVNLKAGAPDDNAGVIGSLIQGARGLVTLSGNDTRLSVVLYPVDSTVAADPCTAGNDLAGVNIPFLYTLSPDTREYLLVNVSSPGLSLCQVPEDNFSALGPAPTFTGGEGVCAPSRFASPTPRTYYPVNFVPVGCCSSLPVTALGDTVGKQTDLNFYPHLSASGSTASGTNLSAAIACINSTASTLSSFGSVHAFVVQCENFYATSTIQNHLSTCQTALYRVRGIIGGEAKLFVSLQVRPTPATGDDPANNQGLHIASAIYNTSVTGVMLDLDINATATSETDVGVNFGGVAAIARALSVVFSQAGSSGTLFNLILRFNSTYCGPNGPLTPQGSGDDQISVYSSCTFSGMNCLFTADSSNVTATVAEACGFPEHSVLSWVALRGVATAPTSGEGTHATNCNASAVVAAYDNTTIASIGPLDGPRFVFGTIGGAITPTAAGAGANALCVFSEDGAGAGYGIVACNSSSADFVKDCVGGFDVLHDAASDAAIVAQFDANISTDNLAGLAETAGRVLNGAGWAGVYIDLLFGNEDDAGTNLEAVTSFVAIMVDGTTLPPGTNLTVGIGVGSAAECMAGGALYSSNLNTTLYARLTSIFSGRLSFVLISGDTLSVPVTELCGFQSNWVGYELQATRTFAGACSNVDLTYELVTLPVALVPINPSTIPITPLTPSTTVIPATPLDPSIIAIPATPLTPSNSSGGGGEGNESSPSPYWAFFAIPGAAILICFVSTGTVAVLHYHHQHRHPASRPTAHPQTSIRLV